jgi:hypothetical protein
MHKIRVNALVLAFHQAMEFWGRGDAVPKRYPLVLAYVKVKDPQAAHEAANLMMEEVRAHDG